MNTSKYQEEPQQISTRDAKSVDVNDRTQPVLSRATYMSRTSTYRRAHGIGVTRDARGYSAVNYLIPVVVLVTALAIGIKLASGIAPPSRVLDASAPEAAGDTSRFLLNALLVPAIDDDVFPLRWVDPLPSSGCGPGTRIRVNSRPLLPGAAVPDAPFELDWYADGCHPFGAQGPRFDGRVKLTVFREDSGFSAIVEPSGLRITSLQNETSYVTRGSVYMPQPIEPDTVYEPKVACADPWSTPCP